LANASRDIGLQPRLRHARQFVRAEKGRRRIMFPELSAEIRRNLSGRIKKERFHGLPAK
jgi:hypothetical protein